MIQQISAECWRAVAAIGEEPEFSLDALSATFMQDDPANYSKWINVVLWEESEQFLASLLTTTELRSWRSYIAENASKYAGRTKIFTA